MPHIKSCSAILGMNSTEVLGSSQLFYNSKIETISNILNLLTVVIKSPTPFPMTNTIFHFSPSKATTQAGWAAGEKEHSQPQIEV